MSLGTFGFLRFYDTPRSRTAQFTGEWLHQYQVASEKGILNNDDFFIQLASAATERAKQIVRYDGKYLPIEYPGGDAPSSIGVCSDGIIRILHNIGRGPKIEDALFVGEIIGHFRYSGPASSRITR